jgi:hypothetical protein
MICILIISTLKLLCVGTIGFPTGKQGFKRVFRLATNIFKVNHQLSFLRKQESIQIKTIYIDCEIGLGIKEKTSFTTQKLIFQI